MLGPAQLQVGAVAPGEPAEVGGRNAWNRAGEIGGQLNMAKQVPGKEEVWGLVDWYRTQVAELGVTVKLGTEVSADDLAGFDQVVIATGVIPRDPQIPGQDTGNTVSYVDVLKGNAKVGLLLLMPVLFYSLHRRALFQLGKACIFTANFPRGRQ